MSDSEEAAPAEAISVVPKAKTSKVVLLLLMTACCYSVQVLLEYPHGARGSYQFSGATPFGSAGSPSPVAPAQCIGALLSIGASRSIHATSLA